MKHYKRKKKIKYKNLYISKSNSGFLYECIKIPESARIRVRPVATFWTEFYLYRKTDEIFFADEMNKFIPCTKEDIKRIIQWNTCYNKETGKWLNEE
jgi:hypothetical protein